MKRNLVVSLVGRPNVGKSTLFNRLMRKQHSSITHDMPGVTRDRHYGIAKLGDDENPLEAILVDTGGFYPSQVDESDPKDHAAKFFNIMADHAKVAIEESDVVILVVDVREGLIPFDKTIYDYIRETQKEVWVVCNKFDTEKQTGQEAEFWTLGIDKLYLTSASHNRGVRELEEDLIKKIEDFNQHDGSHPILQKGVTPREDVVARVALIGAPNAGKSTLLNRLIGAERALVSDIPGTTVDPISGYFDLYFGEAVNEIDTKVQFDKRDLIAVEYSDFQKNNNQFFERIQSSFFEEDELLEHQDSEEDVDFEEKIELKDLSSTFDELEEDQKEEVQEKSEGSFWRSIHIVDTAGIRKKSTISDFVESQSVYRSLRCITESDIVIFMIDAFKGISHQDRRLLDISIEKGKSVIVCLNKIDLLGDKVRDPKERKEWLEDLQYQIPWLAYCDLVPISAKHNKGLRRLKQSLIKTVILRNRKVPTGELNRSIFNLIEKNPVVVKKSGGKRLKLKYASQIKAAPPTFLLFTNRSRGIPENYKRYLKNGLRQFFAFDNTPIHLLFRTGSDLEKRMKKVSTKK